MAPTTTLPLYEFVSAIVAVPNATTRSGALPAAVTNGSTRAFSSLLAALRVGSIRSLRHQTSQTAAAVAKAIRAAIVLLEPSFIRTVVVGGAVRPGNGEGLP